MHLRVTFLGTGTSTGIPVVGCSCAVCHSDDPRNRRLRQSVKIEAAGKYFLIDTTPDFRMQLLQHPIPRLDFLLFTHSHADHLMGLDDVRPYNFRQHCSIVAYASANTAKAIRRAFGYIWDATTQIGGGKPQIELIEIDAPFRHEEIEIIPLPVSHGDWTIHGFRIGDFAYITDTNGIPETTMGMLRGLRVLAIDALRPRKHHPTHFTVEEAVSVARQIDAEQTWLIHMAHEVDHATVEATLPERVHLAYDGLVMEI